jgi:putative membrane protein
VQDTTGASANADRPVKVTIWIATAIICAAVLLLNRKLLGQPESVPSFIFRLPMLNAFLNGTCTVLLIFSYRAIRRGNINRHKQLNISAFILSSLFLVSYVTAHYFIPDTRFGDSDHDGVMSAAESAAVSGIKPVYLVILLSHIFLAVIVLPLVLLSFYYGLTDQRKKHRRITRFSFPVWLYVTISGVVVYLMISPYYAY